MQRPRGVKGPGSFEEQNGEWRGCWEAQALAEPREEHRLSAGGAPAHTPCSVLTLPRRDEDLREPLVRRQGSQVSMRVARALIALFIIY